jgi:hypothetical protein
MSYNRPKLAVLECNSYIAFPRYAKYSVPWDDIMINIKPKPVRLKRHRNQRATNRRQVRQGVLLRYFPMFESEASLRQDIASEELRRDKYLELVAKGEEESVLDDFGMGLDPADLLVNHRESAAQYEGYAAEKRLVLENLLASPDGFYVDQNPKEEAKYCPGVYTTWALDRKGMERAVLAFLATVGHTNVRLKWADAGDPAYMLIPG